VTGDRETTNVPTQALYLLNSPFVQDRSAALANRLLKEADGDESRIRLAFQLCYCRDPSAEEERRAMEFLAAGGESPAVEAGGENPRLVSFCQALLSTAEFRNLD
jgi:hypothetical protein